jgi:hypothetical protein
VNLPKPYLIALAGVALYLFLQQRHATVLDRRYPMAYQS